MFANVIVISAKLETGKVRNSKHGFVMNGPREAVVDVPASRPPSEARAERGRPEGPRATWRGTESHQVDIANVGMCQKYE